MTVIDHAPPPDEGWLAASGGIRALLWFCQRIDEEHFGRVALVGRITAPVWVEIAARYKRIKLRVGQVDRAAMNAVLAPTAVTLHRLADSGLLTAWLDYPRCILLGPL
jgi:hypothetical protein